MKKIKAGKFLILFSILFLLMQQRTAAQDDTASKQIVKLQYFSNNNSMQYLVLESSLKKNKVFTPQQHKTYDLFLDSSSAANLVAKLVTNEEGKAKTFIPVSLKGAWDASPQHTFIVKAGDEEIISDYAISKAKIKLDTATADGVRSITASVLKLENDAWVPVKDVELKIGIVRLGGILPAGDEATYTTDSTGTVTVELKKDSLPGDSKGNYTIAAKVEDNDQFGNLQVEQKVPWGTVLKTDNSFFNLRTLWTTRFRTPYWLLLMAYSIVIAVWGTMIYLVLQIIKIKKLGV